MVGDPLMVPQILLRVGPAAMADWLLHLGSLAAYTFLDWDAQASLAAALLRAGCPRAGWALGGGTAEHGLPQTVRTKP